MSVTEFNDVKSHSFHMKLSIDEGRMMDALLNENQGCLGYILAAGMIIMILVSILTAYLEAMLYLKSQQTTPANNNHTNAHNSHFNDGSNSSSNHERNHCSNHSNDACNKDRGNGSGRGASAISASIVNCNNNKSNAHSKNSLMTNGKALSNSNGNYCTQKKRKNSSTNSSEKVPTSHGKTLSSTTNDKKSSSPYAPMFQNHTNVIASPPPPLPTFDTEFNSLEFKKLRGKKSAKKSNSLNGSITSSEDLGNPNTFNQSGFVNASQLANKTITAKPNGKTITTGGLKMNGVNYPTNGERNLDTQAPDRPRASTGDSRQGNTRARFKNAFTSASISDDENCTHDGTKVDRGHKKQNEQPAVMPIRPPSSSLSSSTPSSIASSSTASSSSSSSSSTSPSPPLSASSYGEYSLLGPGATFELPCLRVRSAQI